MPKKVANLTAARKDRARAAARKAADANAAKYGRTKAEKTRDADAAARAARHLDHHKRGDT